MRNRKCIVCGNEFYPTDWRRKTCSDDCRYKLVVNNHKSIKKKKCFHCGNEFRPYTSLDKFCSANCRIRYAKSKRKRNWTEEQVKKRIGINNPAYRNGNYTRQIKRTFAGNRLFARNATEIEQQMISDKGYKYCQFCKTSITPRFERHHIVFRSEKPNHTNLHDKINILITCIQCHNNLHKQKTLRNNIIKERKLNEIFGNDILLNRLPQ